MSRLKASLIHLGISSTALFLLAIITLFYWYPHPFYLYEGVLSILSLITLVDVILGPIFTFIVFKSGKPSLKFDLTVIALVQIIAFIFGTHTIHSQHPEFVTYVDGVMVTIPTSAIDEQKSELESLNKRFHVGPKFAVASLPEYLTKQINFSVEKSIVDVPEFYSTYPPEISELARNALDISSLHQDSENGEKIDNFLANNNLSQDDVYMLVLVNNLKLSIIVLDKNTGLPVGYLDINPKLKS